MCKFGCDELFEKGYITGRDGKALDLSEYPTSEDK